MTATYRRSSRKSFKERARTQSRKPSPLTTSVTTTGTTISAEFFTPPSPEPVSIYNIIEDCNRGALPSNEVLLKFFDSWQSSPVLRPDPRLSSHGQDLVSDLRGLGQLLARIIRERNGDELIQRFIGRLSIVARRLRSGGRKSKIAIHKDRTQKRRLELFGRRDVQLKREMSERVTAVKKDFQDLASLIQLALTSTDFRNIVSELQELFARMMRVQPTPSKPGKRIPGVGAELSTAEYESLRRRVSQKSEEISRMKPGASQKSEETYRMNPGVVSGEFIQRVPSIEYYTKEEEVSFSEKQPMEHTERKEQREQLSSSWEIPTSQPQEEAPIKSEGHDEIHEILIEARRVFSKLIANESFVNAIKGVYRILVRWKGQVLPITGENLPSDLQYDANFQAAQYDFLQLLERFAGGASLQPVISALDQIRRETLDDYELFDFLCDWKQYMNNCVTDKNYLEHEEYFIRGRYLIERTADYADKKYRKLFEDNAEGWNKFLQGWKNDKVTNSLGTLLNRIIVQDLFGLSAGERPAGVLFSSVRTSFLADLRNVILPAMLREMYELPLPQIELAQGPNRIALDGVVIPTSLFAPSSLDLRSTSRLHVTPMQRFAAMRARARLSPDESPWRAGSRLEVAGMRGDIKNVRFAMVRDQWPKIIDQGRLDMRLGGNDSRKGLSIVVNVLTDINPTQKKFDIQPSYVKVKLSSLKLSFYNVHHDTLFAIMKPYMQASLKTQIEREICDRIVTSLEQLDRLAKRIMSTTSVFS